MENDYKKIGEKEEGKKGWGGGGDKKNLLKNTCLFHTKKSYNLTSNLFVFDPSCRAEGLSKVVALFVHA